MNFNKDTASFVTITCHQKESLGCAVYSHRPTHDSYNNYIHSCYLPFNCATKAFVILQRLIKSQILLVSAYIWTQQKSISFSSGKVEATFSALFLSFQISSKGNYLKDLEQKKKKMQFLPCPSEEMFPHFKLDMKTFSYFTR